MEENNIQLQAPSQLSQYYRSGVSIMFECKYGYRKQSQIEKFRAQCLDGVITYPQCEGKGLLPKTWGRASRRQFCRNCLLTALSSPWGLSGLVFMAFPPFFSSLHSIVVVGVNGNGRR